MVNIKVKVLSYFRRQVSGQHTNVEGFGENVKSNGKFGIASDLSSKLYLKYYSGFASPLYGVIIDTPVCIVLRVGKKN
jgi:hypothetical protein